MKGEFQFAIEATKEAGDLVIIIIIIILSPIPIHPFIFINNQAPI
jgi:hypothetical protein